MQKAGEAPTPSFSSTSSAVTLRPPPPRTPPSSHPSPPIALNMHCRAPLRFLTQPQPLSCATTASHRHEHKSTSSTTHKTRTAQTKPPQTPPASSPQTVTTRMPSSSLHCPLPSFSPRRHRTHRRRSANSNRSKLWCSNPSPKLSVSILLAILLLTPN